MEKKKKPITKKWWFWVIVVILVIAIIGSTGGNKEADTDADDNQEISENIPDEEVVSDASDNEGSSEDEKEVNASDETDNQNEVTAQSANAAELGDYYVEIKSAKLAEDYEGKPCIVVTYAWTNNSDETTNALTSVICKAFQNGIGLENAIIADREVYDSNSFMTDVRPGTTIDVQIAFLLGDSESIVEVEIGEFLTFESNPPVAYMEFNPSEL